MSLTLDRLPIDLALLPEQLHKHLESNAAPALKMMAAQGMLPVSPAQNIAMLYQLANFADRETKRIASVSFDALPDEIILPTIPAETNPGILDWIADRKRGSDKILEALLSTRIVDSATVARVAAKASTAITEVIATNQVRLLQAPVIIEQLYLNANARMATIDRIVELAQRENIELKGLPGLQNALRSGKNIFEGGEDAGFDTLLKRAGQKGDEQEAMFQQSEGLTPSERARFYDKNIYIDPRSIDKEMVAAAMKTLRQPDGAGFDAIEKSYRRMIGDEILPENIEEIARAFQVLDTSMNSGPISSKIARMSISQKIRLATVGSRNEINILVKDPNPLVHSAACKSPRVKYPDIRSWAKNKAIPDAVVKSIAENKEHTKKREIKYLLCMNPKTPLASAIRFMNFLTPKELKKIASDRNIPMQLRRQAKTLTTKRSGK